MLMQDHFKDAMELYQKMLDEGIAKECARFVLPRHAHQTLHVGMQVVDPLYNSKVCKRHTEGAHGHCRGSKQILIEQFPTVSEALSGNEIFSSNSY